VVDRLSTVRTVSALFAGSESVQREDFRAFSKPLLENYEGVPVPGVGAAGALAQRSAHERTVHEEGFADYGITEQNARGDYVPAGQRDEYYPMTLLEPFRDYHAHFGYDVGSNAVYGAAVRRAMATGRPVAAVSPRLDGGGTTGNRLVVVEPAWNEHSRATERLLDRPEAGQFRAGSLHVAAHYERGDG